MANVKPTKNNINSVGRVRPALDPEVPTITQPYKEFVSKGWISSLSVKFTPMGVEVVAELGPAVKGAPAGSHAIGQAKELIVLAGLWSPKTKSSKAGDKEGARPKRSLVKKDFLDGTEKLINRAKAVADALGSDTARGRIGSLGMSHEGLDTFEKWWAVAPNDGKVRLLTDKKYYVELTQDDFDMIENALPQSPFLGVVPTPKKEDEEEEPVKPAAKPAKAGSPKRK